MSYEYPEVLILTLNTATCLPVGSRPYVTIDVREKEKDGIPTARSKTVNGTVEDVVWDEEMRFVLKTSTMNNNQATITITLWDDDSFHTDKLLGRATWITPRSPHLHSSRILLSHSNPLPRRSISVSVRTYTASRSSFKRTTADQLHSNNTIKRVQSTVSQDSYACDPDSFSDAFEIQKASQLLSRKLVSWFAKRAKNYEERCAYLLEVCTDITFKKKASDRQITDLEGLLSTRGELYRKEVDSLQQQLSETHHEMEAALQALNHSDQLNEDNSLFIRSLKSENKHLQIAIQSLHNELSKEKGNNIEGAAVEILLSGGDGKMVELLSSQVRMLKSENKILRLKELRLSQVEELVHHMTNNVMGNMSPQPPNQIQRKKSRPGTGTRRPHGINRYVKSDIMAVRRELNLL